MKDEAAKPSTNKFWYKKPLGIVIVILLLPFFATWYAWVKSNWSKNVKIGVTIASALLVIIGIASNSNKQTQTKTANQPLTQQTPKIAETPRTNTPKFVFDVPSLVGKNIDEVRVVLGTPQDGSLTEPNKQQLELGVDEWDNTFKKDNQELLITFNPTSRVIIDFFLSGDNKDKLLEVGNLKTNSSNYKIEVINALRGGGITGVKVIPE
jgi:hypothetical protein